MVVDPDVSNLHTWHITSLTCMLLLKYSLGPSSRTRARRAFGPYNITSALRPESFPPPIAVSAGIDVSDILKNSVQAETQKLDNDGEDADGMEISSDPVPQRPHGSTTGQRIYRRQPVRKCTGANVPIRRPHSVSQAVHTASTSVQQTTRSITRSLTEKARTKLSSKMRRSNIRVQTAQATHGGQSYKPRTETRGDRGRVLASIKTSMDVHALPHNKPGYTGKRDPASAKNDHVWTREELLADGFRFIEWDGM